MATEPRARAHTRNNGTQNAEAIGTRLALSRRAIRGVRACMYSRKEQPAPPDTFSRRTLITSLPTASFQGERASTAINISIFLDRDSDHVAVANKNWN